MEEIEQYYLQPYDKFLVWYRNGCTSGLNDEQAGTKFKSLTAEEQRELQIEYENVVRIILEGRSGWTAPFAG